MALCNWEFYIHKGRYLVNYLRDMLYQVFGCRAGARHSHCLQSVAERKHSWDAVRASWKRLAQQRQWESPWARPPGLGEEAWQGSIIHKYLPLHSNEMFCILVQSTKDRNSWRWKENKKRDLELQPICH